MGRPPTKPKRFKDGFYIEVRNKGANMGMKIHFDSEIEMKEAAQMYGSSKEVVVLGEHKKDKWLSLEGGEEKRERKSKANTMNTAKNITFSQGFVETEFNISGLALSKK